ncbi:MAG: tetraacyldisaccharide 4'-kinase [Phycisphaerales bacterium JB052]
MSWLYRIAIGHRNRGFDAGKGVAKLDMPVISIGNLSTGGTGKSPMVHRFVRMLQDMGHHPVIAMRGYGAKAGEKGDEQQEHEMALPGVPIVAQPDRLAGLRSLLASPAGAEIDCVVLDDGFQHRKIARDLDVVLIDALRPPDRDALLPKGHLREPIESLARAGLIVLTHCERVDDAEIARLRALVAQHHPKAPALAAHHAWSGFVQHTRQETGWDAEQVGMDDLRAEPFRVVCGIGNTDAFLRMFMAAGLHQKEVIRLRDHATLPDSAVAQLGNSQNEGRISPVFMTRKDWVKTRDHHHWERGSRVVLPILSIEFGAEEDGEQLVLDQLYTLF